MQKISGVIAFIIAVLGVVSMIFSDVLGLATGIVPEELQNWGLIFFMFGVCLNIFLTQAEILFNSKIELVYWGIQKDKGIYIPVIKKFLWKERTERILTKFPAMFIEIGNRPRWGNKSIEGIMPHISWYDQEGKLIIRNNGRWWRSHVSTYQDTSILQSINLDPNGQTRLLHFARFWEGEFHAWYRTQDNKEPPSPLPEGEYHLEIELRSNSGSRARFDFLVSYMNEGLHINRMEGYEKIKRRIKRKRIRI